MLVLASLSEQTVQPDSKITATGFLTYLIYGVMCAFQSEVGFVLPYPLIAVFIPILALVFFILSVRNWEAIFFILFSLTAINALLPLIGVGSVELWLIYISAACVPLFIYSNLIRWSQWNGFKWIPVMAIPSFIAAYLCYLYWPQYLVFPLVLLFGSTLLMLLLNLRKFTVAPVLKRQYLLLAFTSALLLTTYCWLWIN